MTDELFSVAGQNVLITGGSRGIGRAIAEGFAARGANVLICSRSQESVDTAIAELTAAGHTVRGIACDVAQPEQIARTVAESVTLLGHIDTLINVAGMNRRKRAETVTLDDYDTILDTNLRGPILLSQAFARQLPPEAHGNIINIIDQRVWKLNPRFFSYTMSKTGLWTATRTLAQALAPRIRVNAIGPGPALPSARMDEAEFRKQARLTLLGRGTSPREISEATKFIL